jgi:hypothetical protein
MKRVESRFYGLVKRVREIHISSDSRYISIVDTTLVFGKEWKVEEREFYLPRVEKTWDNMELRVFREAFEEIYELITIMTGELENGKQD